MDSNDLQSRIEHLEHTVVEKTRRTFQGYNYWPLWVAELFPHLKLYVPGHSGMPTSATDKEAKEDE